MEDGHCYTSLCETHIYFVSFCGSLLTELSQSDCVDAAGLVRQSQGEPDLPTALLGGFQAPETITQRLVRHGENLSE